MKATAGTSIMSLMPPRALFSLTTSRDMSTVSFLGNLEMVPSSNQPSIFFRRSMLFLMVWKLVRVPPIQRLVTKNWPERSASALTDSWAWRLVPTKMTLPPLATLSAMKSWAVWKSLTVCCRSMMWMPLRAPKI